MAIVAPCGTRRTVEIFLADALADKRQIDRVDDAVVVDVGHAVEAGVAAASAEARLDDVQIAGIADAIVIEIGVGDHAQIARVTPRRAAIPRITEEDLRLLQLLGTRKRGVGDVDAPAWKFLLDHAPVRLRNLEGAHRGVGAWNVDADPLLVEKPGPGIAVDECGAHVGNGIAVLAVVQIHERRNEDRAGRRRRRPLHLGSGVRVGVGRGSDLFLPRLFFPLLSFLSLAFDLCPCRPLASCSFSLSRTVLLAAIGTAR